MLFSLLILVAIAFLTLISQLPPYHIPTEATYAIQQIINATLQFDGLIQIRLIYHIIGLILLFELLFWSFRILVSIFNFLRGSGSIEI